MWTSVPFVARRCSSARSSSPCRVRFATTSRRAATLRSLRGASDAASLNGRRRSGSFVDTSQASAPTTAPANSATPTSGSTSAPRASEAAARPAQPTAMWNASVSVRTGLRISTPRLLDLVPPRPGMSTRSAPSDEGVTGPAAGGGDLGGRQQPGKRRIVDLRGERSGGLDGAGLAEAGPIDGGPQEQLADAPASGGRLELVDPLHRGFRV